LSVVSVILSVVSVVLSVVVTVTGSELYCGECSEGWWWVSRY